MVPRGRGGGGGGGGDPGGGVGPKAAQSHCEDFRRTAVQSSCVGRRVQAPSPLLSAMGKGRRRQLFRGRPGGRPRRGEGSRLPADRATRLRSSADRRPSAPCSPPETNGAASNTTPAP